MPESIKRSYALQQEYIRGISAWNFDLEDLKNQAALVSRCRSIPRFYMFFFPFFFFFLSLLSISGSGWIVSILYDVHTQKQVYFVFSFKMMMTISIQKIKIGSAKRMVEVIT